MGIAIGGLILGCSLVIALALAQVARQQLLHLAEAHVEQLGLQMARELSTGLDHLAREIATQSTRDVFRNPATPAEDLRAALEKIQKARPPFTHLSIIDAQTARMVAATGGVFQGGLVRGRPVYEEGRHGLFVGDVHDAVLLAKLLPAPRNGEPLRFLDIATPVQSQNGETVAVLAAHLSWEWADEVRETILKSQKGKVRILILNREGRVILSHGPEIPLGTDVADLLPQGFPVNAGVTRWADGVDYVTTVSATRPNGYFPDFGWRIVAQQPLDDALSPLNSLRNWFLLASLLLGLSGAVLAWGLTARILRSLQRLSDATQHWATGQHQPEIPSASSFSDVARMQAAFGHLAKEGRDRLQDANIQENQFLAFADLIPQMVWQAETSGRIEYVSRQWEASLEKAEGLSLDGMESLAHPDDARAFAERWRHSAETGKDLILDARLMTQQSQFRWFRIWGRAVRGPGGTVSRWVGTVTDIDDAMREQERVGLALQDERQAREEAERVTRMKDEFLATLSHELRTPLNAISGWSEVLSHRADANPIVSKAAEVILRNVGIQASLINDLLDMSAVVAGKVMLDLQMIDTAEAVTEIVQSLQTTAQKKGVELRVAELVRPAVVRADRQRFEQILTNLLSNAIKFTDSGGSIVASSWTDQDQVRIEIKDTGCGIAPEFLPFVFDRFRQEDGSSTRRRGGMGLGLAIAKSLAELQGGALSAESGGVGCGSAFILSFPVSEIVCPAPADFPQNAMPPLEGFSFLVADDERDARDAAAALLASLGAHVATAASAAQALAALMEDRFDCLICDIAMPGMDGHELIGEIRASGDPVIAQLPAVALSAYAMRQDRIAAIEAGFQSHVAKPVSMQRLLQALQDAMPQLGKQVVHDQPGAGSRLPAR